MTDDPTTGAPGRMVAVLTDRLRPQELSPGWCPACEAPVRARASESRVRPWGPRHRRRRCVECGTTWSTYEVRREGLAELACALDDLEHELADAHRADLDGAIAGLRHAMRSLQTPYRARMAQGGDDE